MSLVKTFSLACNNASLGFSAQQKLLLDIIEKNGLSDALMAEVESLGESAQTAGPIERFYNDVDYLMSGIVPYAREKAEKMVREGVVAPDEHYVNEKVDLTLAKVFVSAMGGEIAFQYRALSPSPSMVRLAKVLPTRL